MKEKIIKFEKGPRDKKYSAYIQDKKTKQVRKLHFGAKGYQQYRDSTPLGIFSKNDHKDIKRMRRYYSRHSGTSKRLTAINKEKMKSNFRYTPKLLSHIYLW